MRWRCPQYLDRIRRGPCELHGYRCEPADLDPHHLKGSGGYAGAGLTAPDWAAIPLCRPAHTEVQANTEKYRALQYEGIVRHLGQAIEAEDLGWIGAGSPLIGAGDQMAKALGILLLVAGDNAEPTAIMKRALDGAQKALQKWEARSK